MQLGRVTGSAIAKNKDGDKNVILLQVELSDPDDIQTVEYVRQAGEDNNPPNDSAVIVLDLGSAWKIALAVDDLIEPTVDQGEREIYSSDGGVKKAWIRLLKDGTLRLENAAGAYVELEKTKGQLELNGTGDFAVAFNDLKTAFDQLKNDFSNFVTTIYNVHSHATAPAGPISPPSPPLGSASTANIDPAKVATVELP